MLAVAGGDQNLETLKLLIKKNADLTKKDFLGNNLMHLAVAHNSIELLEELIK